jgi:DNA-binding MarR family transcriptional regulator
MVIDSATEKDADVASALERVITWLREARDPQGISASALAVLSRLDASGPLRVTDLAFREGLSQPGMTTLINRLEEADLAVREADSADRRAVRVRITPDGVQRVVAYRASRTSLIAARIAELSTEDQRALALVTPALERFAAAPVPTPTAAESEVSS